MKNLAHYNFKQATEIQQQAIPLTIAGRDLLASSKTGSGKTLAFVLQSRCMVSCAPCWVV
ncbi:ATP-dependent RNA helicase%2C DEAD box family [Vibrio cholerae]|nr:ATP-dependent RNA helicase%2C DEAD box family [Vibrio cholerae]